jgi:hypothetical protein
MRVQSIAERLAYYLSRQVRILTPSIVCRLLNVSPAAAERAMAPLVKKGLVTRRIVRAKAIGPLQGPMAKGKPGEMPPHAGRLSYQAKKRFRAMSVETVVAYFGTEKLLHLFGTEARRPFKPEQVSHDIGVSEMWLYMLLRWNRMTTDCFQGEDCYAAENEKFEKLPDARLIHWRTGEVLLYLEFTGSYRADRIIEFQQDMNDRGIPYWLF